MRAVRAIFVFKSLPGQSPGPGLTFANLGPVSRKNKRRGGKARPGISVPRALEAPAGPAASSPPGSATTVGVSPATVTAAPATSPAAVRPVPGRVTGPRRPAPATQASGGLVDIDARVPYFSSDLRRILITAGAMIVVIIAASFLLH